MRNTLEKGIKVHGKALHLTICMAECADLINEISKMKRGKGDKTALIKEMADVTIVLETLKIIFDIADYDIRFYMNEKEESYKLQLEKEK